MAAGWATGARIRAWEAAQPPWEVRLSSFQRTIKRIVWKSLENMEVIFDQARNPSGSELASGEDICAHMTHTEVNKKA